MKKLSKMDAFEENRIHGLSHCSGGYTKETNHGNPPHPDDVFTDVLGTTNESLMEGGVDHAGDTYRPI